MSDIAKAGAAVVCCMLLLGQCSKDPITGAKVAAGGTAVGVGVGAGIVGAGAAKGLADGVKKGASKRAEGVIAGKPRPTKPRPNGPARPYTPTTMLPVATPVGEG